MRSSATWIRSLGCCSPVSGRLRDREGRLEDRPRRIKVECLPYDECDADALLDELAAAGFIVRYRVEGAAAYIAIPAFLRHQNPHVREAPAVLPPPPFPASTVPASGEHQSCTGTSTGRSTCMSPAVLVLGLVL